MTEVRSRKIELELAIDASRASVWETLVDHIVEWWPRDYLATGNPTSFRFEARPGGSVREESEDGGGLEWFQVQALEPEVWVSLVGFTAPPWGGPSVTTLRLELHDAANGATTLRVIDASFGLIAEGSDVQDGWRAIFEGLRSLAEARAKQGSR